MTPISIAIADDDEGMRLVMRKIIERAEGYSLVCEAKDGSSFMEEFEKYHPQVAVLDVEMPGMDGIACAKAVQDMAPMTVIIFATAHDEYMSDAFELYAFDYLLKPFKVERALKTLSMARERLTGPPPAKETVTLTEKRTDAPTRLMLKHRDGISFVDLDDILLVQREERMTVVYTKDDKRYVTGETLGDVEARLTRDTFFRCHKSYIVNINHIDSISPYGRWTYIVKLRGTKQDALITHERFEALQGLFA